MARTRQYADRVNILKMIKLDGKWRFAPVVERNGKIVRDHVLVKGQDERHPEGSYYLEWYEDDKRRRQPISIFDEVVPAARTKAIELQARRAGILVTLPSQPPPVTEVASLVEVIPPDTRLTMTEAVDRYMEFVKRQRSLRTFRTYRVALRSYFLNCYPKTYLNEVSREDLLRFSNFCFDRGLEACSSSENPPPSELLATASCGPHWHALSYEQLIDRIT